MKQCTSTGRHILLLLLLLPLAAGPLGATEYAFITTTDYSTGSSSVIYLDGSYTNDNNVASIHSDALSRWYNGLVYVVNRENGDNIQILDPSSGFSTIRQFSTGNGSNPKDIAFYNGRKAYITRYETNDLWIVDPSTGTHTGTVDLSSFADGDGLCEMDQMFIKGDILFITIQRLDRNNYWLPVGDSYVAVLDCSADTLVDTDRATPGRQSILLTGADPFSGLRYDHATNRLYVACIGTWGVQDAGVVSIDPFTLQSEGFIFSETAAGGDINTAVILSPTKGYAIVTNASWHTDLVTFNPTTGVKTSTLYSPGGYVLNDIELSPHGELFVADQTATNPGIWIYATANDSLLTPGPIDTGLPPFDITFSIPEFTHTETPPAAALEQNYPNPFNPVTTIRFSVGRTTHVRLSVFDVSGRIVRTLVNGTTSPGTYDVTWNGMDDAGIAAASGVYFIRLAADGAMATKKALLIR